MSYVSVERLAEIAEAHGLDICETDVTIRDHEGVMKVFAMGIDGLDLQVLNYSGQIWTYRDTYPVACHTSETAHPLNGT